MAVLLSVLVGDTNSYFKVGDMDIKVEVDPVKDEEEILETRTITK